MQKEYVARLVSATSSGNILVWYGDIQTTRIPAHCLQLCRWNYADGVSSSREFDLPRLRIPRHKPITQADRQSSLGCWNNGLTTDSGYQQTVSDYDMLSFVRHADNCANNTVRWPRHDIGTAPHPYFPRRRPTIATNWRSIVFSPTTSNQSLFSRVPSRLPSSIHHSRHP